MNTCVQCSVAIRDNSKYCGKCGARQDSPVFAPVLASPIAVIDDLAITKPNTPFAPGNPECPKCGRQLKTAAKYCGSCGTAISVATEWVNALSHDKAAIAQPLVEPISVVSENPNHPVEAVTESAPTPSATILETTPDRVFSAQQRANIQPARTLPMLAVAMVALTASGIGAGYWFASRERGGVTSLSGDASAPNGMNVAKAQSNLSRNVANDAGNNTGSSSPTPLDSSSIHAGLRSQLPIEVASILDERFGAWQFVSPVQEIRAKHAQDMSQTNPYFSYGTHPSLIAADFDGNGEADFAVLISYHQDKQLRAVVAVFLARNGVFVPKSIRVITQSPQLHYLFVRRKGTSGLDAKGEYVYPHDALSIGFGDKHDNSFFVQNGAFVSRDATEPIDSAVFSSKGTEAVGYSADVSRNNKVPARGSSDSAKSAPPQQQERRNRKSDASVAAASIQKDGPNATTEDRARSAVTAAPKERSVDDIYNERATAECARGFVGLICREKLRFTLCDGKWTDKGIHGMTRCYHNPQTNAQQ